VLVSAFLVPEVTQRAFQLGIDGLRPAAARLPVDMPVAAAPVWHILLHFGTQADAYSSCALKF